MTRDFCMTHQHIKGYMLARANPVSLEGGCIRTINRTWKLREHHFVYINMLNLTYLSRNCSFVHILQSNKIR